MQVAADVELPAPQSTETGPAEVTIRQARLACNPGRRIDDGLIQYTLDGSTWLLHYRDTGTFCLCGTDTILVDALPQASPERVLRRLLGSVFGLLLRRRGLMVLHANVLARDGVAILLLGASGAGKSTLSGALRRRGYRVLSDDLGVIDLSTGGCLVRCGLPHLKLRQDSEAALGTSNDGQATWSAFAGKTIQTLETEASGDSVPARALYVLEPGPEIALDALVEREALLALIRHAHLPRSLDVTGCAARHFHQAGRIVREVPLYRLVRGTRLSTLPTLVHTVETHLAHATLPGV